MKIPKKEDMKNFVISAQKGLQKVSPATQEIKVIASEVSSSIGELSAWLADKAEYCNATDVICQKLGISRDVQDFLIVREPQVLLKRGKSTKKNPSGYTPNGVIMPFPKELAEDPFSQVLIECLELTSGGRWLPQITKSRFSNLQKHLKDAGIEGELRLADSWQDLFVKLDESWAKDVSYWGQYDDPRKEGPIQQGPKARIRYPKGLPSRMNIVALMQTRFEDKEEEKKKLLEKIAQNPKMSKKEYQEINARIVELDKASNKYYHLVEIAKETQGQLTDIHNQSTIKNAKNFDRVAERFAEGEEYYTLQKELQALQEQRNRLIRESNHELNIYEGQVKSKEREISLKQMKEQVELEKQQTKALEELRKKQAEEMKEFLKKQKTEKDKEVSKFKTDSVNKILSLEFQEIDLEKEQKKVSAKANKARQTFLEKGRDR